MRTIKSGTLLLILPDFSTRDIEMAGHINQMLGIDMKRRFFWFVAGFAVSWLVLFVAAYFHTRPRDYSQQWEAWQREGVPWIQRAYGRRLGSFMIFTPAQEENAAIIVYPGDSGGFPVVGIEDENQDGKPDAFMVGDSKYRYMYLKDSDSDGTFDRYTYNTGVDDASYSLDDNNMDGIYDVRGGPGRKRSVHVDGTWYELIWKDQKHYVNMDGRLTMVRQSNGVWSVVSDNGDP